MTNTDHVHFRNALRHAYNTAPCVIAWHQRSGRWITYSPTAPAPNGSAPEIFVAKLGVMPLALTPEGTDVLTSFFMNEVGV